MERPRRAPAIEKKISEITEDDIRVRVLGKVAEKGDGFLVLEDDTGKMRVETAEEWKTNMKIRVFGTPMKSGEELALNAEIIQDMSGLDEKLYKNIESFKKGG